MTRESLDGALLQPRGDRERLIRSAAMIATRSVVVVEPEDDRGGGMAFALRRSDLLVHTAGDARSAMAIIVSDCPAVILVDAATPGLTAGNLADAVRQVRPRPVVLVMIDDF